MTILFGLIITLVCMLGGFTAMGGHVWVIWQPWEYVIICGSALGTFVVANPMKTIKDTGKAAFEAFRNDTPTQEENIELLALLFFMMRELRDRSRAEMEMIIDAPQDAEVFKRSPTVTANEELTTFICDYFRLIIMGNARTHEIESLMDEEIETVRHDKLKAYHALVAVGDGLPALGIVAAVLGVVKAMGAIDQSPEILGHLIASALVGTFAGIFFSYAVVGPLATKVKIVRDKKMRSYVIVKQSLLAFMNGAMPQVAIEHGRKAISAYERPTINEVETATMGGGADRRQGQERKAA
ncbi:MAG: flagellar motor stator protein MotA [Proteobacteria bacterium]|nr:flagellar motor stator protein MotA [Pseudomonadota bacterium]MBS0267461.1 flagellar motor stator protein MotA [Pseudomonadota bacterium]